MAFFNLPFGVRIAGNEPVDGGRYLAEDIATRDSLIGSGREFNGLQVFVESESKLYVLTNNTEWVELLSQNTTNIILSTDDKNMSVNTTSFDGDLASNDVVTNTPIDGSYVAVFINGQEFDVGNGVKTNSCYFSGDGGTTARGFFSTHPNGRIESGDFLYWNGTISGTELDSLWRLTLLYLQK